jgi:hypothetical protein
MSSAENSAPEAAPESVEPAGRWFAEAPDWLADAKERFVEGGVWYLVSMTLHAAAIVLAGLLLGNVAEVRKAGKAPEFDTALDERRELETKDLKLEPVKLEKDMTPSQTLSMGVASNGGRGGISVGRAVSSAIGGAPKFGGGYTGRGPGPGGGIGIDVGAVNVFGTSGGTFAAAIPDGAYGDGLSTAQNYNDAMDRITQEILNSLAKGKVLVVWVMDQSESMQDDRNEIMARIDRVYVELGLSSAMKSDALLTGVVSYGASVLNHLPQPSAKPDEIAAAFKSVPVDPSGMEMQSQALMFAVNAYARQAQMQHRQIAIILVTDESGDMNTNIAQTEQVIDVCKQAHAKVYVLGRESIFGYPYAHMRWIDPETKTHHWLRIDRGPETPQPEQLQINGFHRRWDAFPSGFGPYEQSRIARQTGGIFFMLPSPEVQLVGRRADIAYDADAMRPYLPDLGARQDYMAERDKSPFRKVIFQVISDLNPYKQGSKGSRVEVRTDHFSIEPAKFAQEAAAEMKKASDLISYLKEAERALEAVKPYREREKSPRWRANFDLIYAQTISYQARLQEYGWYMAEFLRTPKPIKNPFGATRPTNGWDVALIQRLLKPEVTQATREKADALFRQAQKDYAGTPWAQRAGEELGRGYGIELREDYDDYRALGRNIRIPKF